MYGLLVLSLDETERVCKPTKIFNFSWNDEEVLENLRIYLTKVPSIRNTKIYYNSSGFYFFVDIFDEKYEYILKMLDIFDLNVRRYRLGKSLLRKYILFETLPSHENILPSRKDMNNKEKIIRIFHWIIGVKGRILHRSFEDEYFSIGPYKVDISSKLTKKELNNLFSSKNDMRFFWDFFDSKLDQLRILLSEKHRSWYIQISKRIRMLS